MADLPSVTQALSPYTDFSMVPPERLELAAARGTKLHGFAAKELREEWIPPDMITPDIEGYWESFMIFKEKMIEKTIFVEKELICTCYGYVGHLDWCGILRGDSGAAVLDWKSPVTEGRTWGAQVAGYWHLVDEHGDLPGGLPLSRCGALMLSPTGKTPKLKEYSAFQPVYFNNFLNALGAWKAFKS